MNIESVIKDSVPIREKRTKTKKNVRLSLFKKGESSSKKSNAAEQNPPSSWEFSKHTNLSPRDSQRTAKLGRKRSTKSVNNADKPIEVYRNSKDGALESGTPYSIENDTVFRLRSTYQDLEQIHHTIQMVEPFERRMER